MRITRIDVRGAAPNRRAELTRDGGNVIASVWVEGEVHSHVVGATRRDDLYEMARRVQHALDGHIGTNSMVHDYFRLIERLAD
ncbi:MAG: hypothetical protein R6X33_04380 [Candidatus Brocadiia bacterium]